MMKRLLVTLGALLLFALPGFAQESGVSVELPEDLVLVFEYVNPDADKVTVSGSFNEWDTEASPMELIDGVWTYSMMVNPADTIEFKYVVDGTYLSSMEGLVAATSNDPFGGKNGLVVVADLVGGGDDIFRPSIKFGTFTQVWVDNKYRTISLGTNDDDEYTKGLDGSSTTLNATSLWRLDATVLPGVTTYAEIKAFDGSVTLFQQAPDASADEDNPVDPEVSVLQGLSNLGDLLFGPFYGLNNDTRPSMNQFKAGIKTGIVDFSTAYMGAKSDVQSRNIIFNHFNNGVDSGDGIFEISTGDQISQLGDIATLDALFGFTRRIGGLGMYSWVDFSIENLDATIYYNTVANRLSPNEIQYYWYDAQNTIGLGVDLDIVPDMLDLQFEALTYIDATGDYAGLENLGFALNTNLTLGAPFSTGLYARLVGPNVTMIHGDNNAENHELKPGLFRAGVSPSTTLAELVNIGVNYDLEVAYDFSGDLTNKFNPYLNLYFNPIIGIDMTLNGYGKMSLIGSEFAVSEIGGSLIAKNVAILSEIGAGYTYKESDADTGFFVARLGSLGDVLSSAAIGYSYTEDALAQGAVFANARFANLGSIPSLDVDLGWKSEAIYLVGNMSLDETVKVNLGTIVRLAEGEDNVVGGAMGVNLTLPEEWESGSLFFQMGYDFYPYSGPFGTTELDGDYLKNLGGGGEAYIQAGFKFDF